MEPIRILLVDDHQLVREGIASLVRMQPDMEVVGEAAGGIEALERARALLPDVVLMDVQMPAGDGITATELIKAEIPSTKVLMLTVSEDNADLFRAVRGGAHGYLVKNLPAEQLFTAIREVHLGFAPITRQMADGILSAGAAAAAPGAFRQGLDALTAREREVLQLVGQGYTNREMAGMLFITENTVKIHMRNILEKLHLHNRVQAAAFAQRQGLLDGQG